MSKGLPYWLSKMLGRSRSDDTDDMVARSRTSSERDADCMEVRMNASDFIDGESAPSLTNRIKRHLGICSDCNGWVKTFAATVGFAREMPQEEVPETLHQKIRDISSGDENYGRT